ncbi:GNAT family N-acetyltransferase [Pseudozobellia thermophila]|nr:GNAT family N-acetyltransferase [Pseudozobellia thermophila]
MIEELQHYTLDTAKQIRRVFQASYKIEAELLKATDFPPLKRPLEAYLKCDSRFFGYTKQGQLAGVIEIGHNAEFTHVRSLVVHPHFFRQGIAKALMEFTLNSFDSSLFAVETGLKNGPASHLYKKLGFTEVEQWDTDHGVRKVKFELRKP